MTMYFKPAIPLVCDPSGLELRPLTQLRCFRLEEGVLVLKYQTQRCKRLAFQKRQPSKMPKHKQRALRHLWM